MGVYNHIILAKNMGPDVPLRHFFTFKGCGKFGHSHEDELYERQKFKISLYFSNLKNPACQRFSSLFRSAHLLNINNVVFVTKKANKGGFRHQFLAVIWSLSWLNSPFKSVIDGLGYRDQRGAVLSCR